VDCTQALIGLSRRHRVAMAEVGRQPAAQWAPSNRILDPEPEGHCQQNPHRVAWFSPQLESRGGQQWSLPNFVPSSLKWTPPRAVGGHAEFARLNELQVLVEA
jgi:hypothetical protein